MLMREANNPTVGTRMRPLLGKAPPTAKMQMWAPHREKECETMRQVPTVQRAEKGIS